LNTNDFGDVKTFAKLAQVAPAKIAMNATTTSTNANLVSGSTYLHGVALADFAVTCGNLTGVTLWAPVQDECSIGTLADNIDQTLFLDEVYINSLEYSYTTGANATENYGAETDNKMWLLNAGKFVNYESTISGSMSGTDSTNALTAAHISDGYIDLSLDVDDDIAVLTTGLGFLRKDDNGVSAVTYYDTVNGTATNVAIVAGVASDVGNASGTDGHDYTGEFVYEDSGTYHRIYFPTSVTVPIAGDVLQVVYSADAYAASMNQYFTPLTEAGTRPDAVGALRQGQIEVYIVDPDSVATSLDNAWRLTGTTISTDLTREPLAELGHLGPYDRPLTLPIPITISIDTTAGDLENWAKFAGKLDGYDAMTMTSVDLTDLMTKDNLTLVVKVFEQTDEEAGGATGEGRKVLTGSAMVGDEYFLDGTMATYTAGMREYALKTVIVKNLKITDEGMTLDVGSNATQTFGFKSNNDLFAVKGDISYNLIAGVMRNV